MPLHCTPAWSNLVVIISMDLHPIRQVEFDRASKGFNRQCNLNEFTPNLTGRIRPAIQPVEFDRALITGQIG